jgi:hypothetical protein
VPIEAHSGTEMRFRPGVVDVRITGTIDDDGHERARTRPKRGFSRAAGISEAICSDSKLVEKYSTGCAAVILSLLIRRRPRSGAFCDRITRFHTSFFKKGRPALRIRRKGHRQRGRARDSHERNSKVRTEMPYYGQNLPRQFLPPR